MKKVRSIRRGPLPLEGDPEAVPARWNPAAQAGVLLVTPAQNRS